MRKFLLAVGFTLGAAFALAAPIPSLVPGYEVMTTYHTLAEYDAATIKLAGPITGYEDRSNGTKTLTENGWYNIYVYQGGWMILSTIPDGRLRYGFFDRETGEAIKFQGHDAPRSCIACHNKNKAK